MAERTSTRKSTSKTAGKTGKKKTASPRTASSPNRKPSAKVISPRERWQMIADAAFFRAESRGFAPGGEIADWLAAEMEVDALLMGKSPKTGRHH